MQRCKILYTPLDERPCNYKYPQMIAALAPELELVVPQPNLLGNKKRPANTERLWSWIQTQAGSCQAIILSIEMLVYGGLLPSRLHQQSQLNLEARLQRLKILKLNHPNLLIFASSLIMRTPRYNSSEEEPHYYAKQGKNIFRWGWLRDRQQRSELSLKESKELESLNALIPNVDLRDYRQRRQKNIEVNKMAIDLVDNGIIDFLAIPQDDSARYGFTALDQKQVVDRIIERRLQQQVHLYPGADEVGCTLLARAYLQLGKKSCRFYPLISSVRGELIVPLYEDRPLGESLKSQILAAGAHIATEQDQADVVLAINSAGKVMQESWDQRRKDITYSSYRNLRFFADHIRQLCDAGKSVAIADVAFANGGETELIELLDDLSLLDHILAYGGWNTSCNTLGSVIATAILGQGTDDIEAIAFNKIHHLIEDWAYQAIVRMQMVKDFLPTVGATYYNFASQDATIHEEIARRLMMQWQQTLRSSFQDWSIEELKVSTPWNRMFEIDLSFRLSTKTSDPLPASAPSALP
ncbi:MAG: DUF4127 family protein, partial [Cyanobacteria bacterium P01_F01_bin.42]